MADTNITWNGTPIDNIERNSLSLKRINENGTIMEMVDTINANFQNIAKHGGGPAGIDGADGADGVDGTNVEYIYVLCDEMNSDVQYPTDSYERAYLFDSVKSAGSYKYKGVTWFDNAQPISPEHKNEYVWSRIKRGTGLTEWYYTSEPVLWSHWGETGKDGDGVEYIFLASSNELTSIALNTSLLKIENMDDFQKVIFNIDDFYPGKKWFNSGENKQKVRLAISKKGLEISDSTFDTRWEEYFKFCDDTYSWTDEPTGTGPSVLYEYVSIRKSTTDKNGVQTWGNFSTPALWSNYNLPTKTAIIYCNLKEDVTPELPTGGWVDMSTGKLVTNKPGYELTPDYWKDTNDDIEENKITWMCTGVFNHTGENAYWSSPVRITGSNGKNGEDGAWIEFIYTLTTYGKQPDYPSITNKEELDKLFDEVEKSDESPKYSTWGSSKWYDRAQSISIDNPVEYMAQRSKKPDEKEWTYTEPIIWSHWGEDGTDGDGVEYIFFIQSAENFSDSEEEWNNRWSFLSSSDTSDDILIKKAVYSMDEFYPNASWFNQDLNKNNVREILKNKYNKTFTDDDWNTAWTGVSTSFNWDWRDNPGDVTPSLKYQYVSIRKTKNNPEDSKGKEWGVFSYPKLWSKYAIIKFKSIAFAATTFDTDLSGCTVTGGDFSNPIPNLTKKGDKIIDVIWTDSPEPVVSAGKTQIWMTSANVSEDSTSALVWSDSQKMTDTADLQVEWSSTDKSLTELVNINSSLTNSKYNFGTFLNANNYNENAAELAWRTAMSDDFGISFGDSSENAILMATCQLKNGVWSDWKITRVKGEKGDAGTSVNIKDKIIYESYLTSGTEYNYTNANNRRGTYTPNKTPENGDLLIVYPAERNENGIYYGDISDGGKLYMWKYTNEWVDYNDHNSIGEETGNTYVSPNGHLILWDGDSWQDLGNIAGPEGKSYTIAVKYAKDGENGDKTEITNDSEIPNAKWIGICVYEEGTTIPDIKDSSWKWSLFKGQDGYGYEYIFKATSTKDSASIPQVPQMPSGGNWYTTHNIIPEGWTDDPIEPSEKDRYIWMCWRKFDHEKQQWTDFMGVENTTNAKLWHFYVTDGKPGAPGAPGEAGNGYQYKYIRYDNSVNYGSTTCTVTNASEDEPIFKIGAVVVSSTDSAQGADSGHTYEYRSERYGHTGSWSNWSNPVIIAKYLDDSDIQATVQREVQTATSGIEDSIRSDFKNTTDYVDILKNYVDDNGVFSGTLSKGTKDALLDGYIKTNELSGAIEQVKLSGFGVDSETNTARTFSDWINYEDHRFTSVNQELDSLNGRLTTAVNDIKGKADSTALTEYQTKADAKFAQINNTVANGVYVTDSEGYLLVKEEDGAKRRALDKDNQPTKNYTDVIDSDKEKLIYVTTELASISQTVSDGIACTSIVTSTENGAAIFYQQVDDNGSKIYMDANTIGISSNYFNLDNSGLNMTGNLLAKDENGIITAGVIGDDTADNDVKFFAGTNNILSPITKQKLICVKDRINENNPSQIFVRYPSLDKISTGRYKDNILELWDKDSYDYNPDNRFDYSGTFVYNGSTYYMWKLAGKDFIAVLTTERYYTTNNLKYHNGDFSLTPKIVAFLNNDEEYNTVMANLTYIVDFDYYAQNEGPDAIYVDQFYDAYAWVLDSNSEGVSLYDYHNSQYESLDTNLVIYTEDENVNINDILGIKISSTETSSYKVIDVTKPISDIKQSSFRVYEDGTVYMSKAIVDAGGYIESSFVDLDEETIGSVKMSGGSLVYNVSGNMWGGTAVVGYRTSADKGLISIYPNNDDPGLYIARDGGRGFSVEIESGPVGIRDKSCIELYGNSYIESHGNAVYKGFKTPITRIESSGDHDISDSSEYHTILTAGSKIKLKTSNSPANGTEYDIYVWKYDIGLDMNGKGALKFVNGSPATEYGIDTAITLSKDTYYHIVYDGTCWLIHQ